MTTTEKVKEIIKKVSENKKIKLKDRLTDDLLLDSLAMVNLLIDIEEEFDINLNESDMDPYEFETVNDIVELVRKYDNGKN